MQELLQWLLHVDDQLRELVKSQGSLTYAILALIIFVETGLVFFPFLPGDSLLFAAGSLAAAGSLNLWVLLSSLTLAAILGDTVNYHLGQTFGTRLPFINRKHLEKTHEYFEKYGGKTIILARFVPIVRTFAPFVAGMGAMTYSRFLFYNVLGAVAWVFLCTLAGYYFARIEFVERNFELVILGIVAISLLPMAVEFLLHVLRARAAKTASAEKSVTTPPS